MKINDCNDIYANQALIAQFTTSQMIKNCQCQKDLHKLNKLSNTRLFQIIIAVVGDKRCLNNILDIKPIGKLINLEEVEIQSTQIASCDILQHCTRLRKISLSECCQISQVDFLKYLPELEELHLQYLTIAQVNISGVNNKLRILCLNGCDHLTKLTGLENCFYLEKLLVGETLLVTLHIPKQMKALKSIKADGCRNLEQITGLGDCQYFQSIDVEQTQISDISSLASLKHLQYVDFNKTCLPKKYQTCSDKEKAISKLLYEWKQTEQYRNFVHQNLIQQNRNKIVVPQKRPQISTPNNQQCANACQTTKKADVQTIKVKKVQDLVNTEVHVTVTSIQNDLVTLNNKVDQNQIALNSRINDLTARLNNNQKLAHIQIESIYNTLQQLVKAVSQDSNKK